MATTILKIETLQCLQNHLADFDELSYIWYDDTHWPFKPYQPPDFKIQDGGQP